MERARHPSPARQRRAKGRPLNGWLVLDKPTGETSTRAVAIVKRAFDARKAGHAGTLDPLASGILPVAFGDATKTVQWVQDGLKEYAFGVAWGAETDTDDSEGAVTHTSEVRPTASDVAGVLSAFVGQVEQSPPSYSAVKVHGQRAYDLARNGNPPELAPRLVFVDALEAVSHGDGRTEFFARCGKGTYVRSLARDIGRALGCLGHVVSLRRTRVGPFSLADAVTLDGLAEGVDEEAIRPVEAGLGDLARVLVDRDDAARLRRGQPILLRGAELPPVGQAYASFRGAAVAVGLVEAGELRPTKVFDSFGAR